MSDDTYAQPASEGRSRDEGAGRNQSGFSLRNFGQQKGEAAMCRPSCYYLIFYAAFFPVLVLDCAVFLAFSLAANSCFTLRAMASVFTLYVVAAS